MFDLTYTEMMDNNRVSKLKICAECIASIEGRRIPKINHPETLAESLTSFDD